MKVTKPVFPRHHQGDLVVERGSQKPASGTEWMAEPPGPSETFHHVLLKLVF